MTRRTTISPQIQKITVDDVDELVDMIVSAYRYDPLWIVMRDEI